MDRRISRIQQKPRDDVVPVGPVLGLNAVDKSDQVWSTLLHERLHHLAVKRVVHKLR